MESPAVGEEPRGFWGEQSRKGDRDERRPTLSHPETVAMLQPFWAAAFLQPQRHRLALHCLTVERGYEVYAPQIVGRPLWRGRAGEFSAGASVRQLRVRAHRRAAVPSRSLPRCSPSGLRRTDPGQGARPDHRGITRARGSGRLHRVAGETAASGLTSRRSDSDQEPPAKLVV